MPISPVVFAAPESSAKDQIIFATASYDHDIKLWQAHTGICERTLQHPESQVNDLKITPDRQLLAAAGYQHIRMYDLNCSTPNHLISYEKLSKNVTSIEFEENGKWMCSGGEDGTAKIWDLRSRNLQISRIFKVDTPINCVCLHPNQVDVFCGDQAGVVHIWDINAKHNDLDPLIPDPGSSIQSMDIDSKGHFLAAVNNKGMVYIWSLSLGPNSIPLKLTPAKSIQAHNNYALKVKFSPDSSLLVTTSADRSARVWSTTNFTLIMELKDESQRWVWDVAFSADAQFLITGSSDNTARAWNLVTGKVVREFSGHRRAISALAFLDNVTSQTIMS